MSEIIISYGTNFKYILYTSLPLNTDFAQIDVMQCYPGVGNFGTNGVATSINLFAAFLIKNLHGRTGQ